MMSVLLLVLATFGAHFLEVVCEGVEQKFERPFVDRALEDAETDSGWIQSSLDLSGCGTAGCDGEDEDSNCEVLSHAPLFDGARAINERLKWRLDEFSRQQRSFVQGDDGGLIGGRPLASSAYLTNRHTVRRTFNEIFRYYLPFPGLKIINEPDTMKQINNNAVSYLKNLQLEKSVDEEALKKALKNDWIFHRFLKEHSPLVTGAVKFEEKNLGLQPNLTAKCVADVLSLVTIINILLALPFPDSRLRKGEVLDIIWPIAMVDSWGKAEDGNLLGNRDYLGFMKECLNIDARAPFNFSGQYCLVKPKKKGSVVPGVLPASYGTCIPSSCTKWDLKASLDYHLQDLNHTASWVSCQKKDDPAVFGPWEIAGCVIIGSLALLVLVSAAMDLAFKKTCPRFFKAFSAAESMSKILAVRPVDAPGEISCIYGIRVMTICWVMLGHQYYFFGLTGSNIMEFYGLTEGAAFQIIFSGLKAVDTFFTIGGLLVTRALFRESFCFDDQQTSKKTGLGPTTSKKLSSPPESATILVGDFTNENGGFDQQEGVEEIQLADKANPQPRPAETVLGLELYDKELWRRLQLQGFIRTSTIFLRKYFLYITNRIIRIWPALFFVVMFTAGPSSLIVRGPIKDMYLEQFLVPCRQNAWTDLTLFTNFILNSFTYKSMNDPDYNRSAISCLSHDWYIAVDFQIQLVLPFLLLPCKILKQKALYLFCLLLVSCLIPGLIVILMDLIPVSLLIFDTTASTDFYLKVYNMPYARASPYFVGALCALLLDQAEEAKKNGYTPKWLATLSKKPVQIVGWLVFFVTLQAVVFGLTGANHYSLIGGVRQLSGVENFLYSSFDISAWAACIGWIVVMCSLKLAGPINLFLSHPMWQPLARVSYAVYLISVPVQYIMITSFFRNTYITHASIFISYCGVVICSFLSAFAISIMAESPFIVLNKWARART